MLARSSNIEGGRNAESNLPSVVYSTGFQGDEVAFGLFAWLVKGSKLALTLIVQIICAFIISQYSISHTRKGEGRLERLLNASLSIYWDVSGPPPTSSIQLSNVSKPVTFPNPQTTHSEVNRKSLRDPQLHYRSLGLHIFQRDNDIRLSCIAILQYWNR